MLTLQNIPLSLSIITAFVVLSLGLLVYNTNKKKLINKSFFGLTILIVIWIISVFLVLYIKDDLINLIGGRVAFASATWIAFLMYYFTYYFPVSNRNYNIKTSIIFTLTFLVFILSSFTPYVLKEIRTINGLQINIYGFGYYLFTLYFLIYTIGSIFNLVSKRKFLSGLEITQVNYILSGFLISTILSLITNLIIPRITSTTHASQFGPLTLVFFIIFSSYAVFKHHLFNIKVIATEIITALIAIMLLVRIPLSKTSGELAFNLIFFHIFLVLGIMLIRTVWLEIHRVEEIEKLNKEKLVAYDQIKKQAEELELANIDLQKLLEMKTEFMRVASHQLRTPTSSIMGMLSMLAEGSVEPEKRDQFIKMAYEASEKLSIIIRDVLSATSLETGRLDLNFQKVDLKNIIREAVNECRSLALQKGLELHVNVPEDLPLITADAYWLKQVFNNLIDNAVFYTPKGEITIDVKNNSGNITAIVKDNGVGITLEDKERLFNKFTRGQHAQQVHPDGSGLGLYIAKSIIDLHRGTISIQSEGQGKGTTVEVVLPKG